MIKLLRKNNIKFSGKETDTWLRDFILAWVIPIVIFILIWRYLFGRLGTGAGITAVGRSKASLYIEKDTGVTFKTLQIDEGLSNISLP